MPIYEFKCSDCGTVSEVLVRRADDQGAGCTHCGSVSMEKLISASYIVKMSASEPSTPCCDMQDDCDTSACSMGGSCQMGDTCHN